METEACLLVLRSVRGLMLCNYLQVSTLLFPLCLAHIRYTNSTPLAIPGVLKVGRTPRERLWKRGGELQRDTLQRTECWQAGGKSNPLLHFVPLILVYLDMTLFPTTEGLHPPQISSFETRGTARGAEIERVFPIPPPLFTEGCVPVTLHTNNPVWACLCWSARVCA